MINLIGINGAALATLLTILIFNTVKIWYVKKKMDMQPFTKKSVLVLGVILSLYLLWYTLEITVIPMANIMAKSILISLVYGFLIYILKISEDLNLLVNQFLNRK